MSAEEFHHSAHGEATRPVEQPFEEPLYGDTITITETSEEVIRRTSVETVTQSPAELRYSEVNVINDSTGLFQEYHDISPKYFDKVSGAELIEDMHRYKELDNELRIASDEFAEFTVLQNTVSEIIPVISGEKHVEEARLESLQQIKQAITVDLPETVFDQDSAESFWNSLGDLTYYKGSLAEALDADSDYLERTLALAEATRQNIADLTIRQQIESFSGLLKEYEPIIDRQVALAQQAVEDFSDKFNPAKNVQD